MTKRFCLMCILLMALLSACNDKSKIPMEELSLLSYGLPVSINAPLDSEIKTMDFGPIKDISIKKGDHFFIQIFSSSVRTTDISSIKSELITEVKSEPYFAEMIEERNNGFIYKTVLDTSSITYGFRVIQVQGDHEIHYQQGLLGMFSLDDVENMYDAIVKN